ncbi:OsmC family protein [Roseateles violae]|uniref:OsmC family protein n=1 Tax=Roseateles violae TaxID=3058042 RepID=A0ABT8DTG4_9BURK|nr:OsmC family protein [Pelomonas sp. PFR6]MDN3920310.1 OsmC family protein [Pelomonas sp. PFR6]
MSIEQIAAAIDRVSAALHRKPQAGVHDDSAATARWGGGLRTQVHSDNGRSVATDMPAEIGGGDSAMSPGWLWRAGLASCAVTRIAMLAASEGLRLEVLEARVTSRSDTRGMLGIAEADGRLVPAQPLQVELHVRIGAPGVSAERLRALVAAGAGCSPVTCVIEQPLPVALHIDVAA